MQRVSVAKLIDPLVLASTLSILSSALALATAVLIYKVDLEAVSRVIAQWTTPQPPSGLDPPVREVLLRTNQKPERAASLLAMVLAFALTVGSVISAASTVVLLRSGYKFPAYLGYAFSTGLYMLAFYPPSALAQLAALALLMLEKRSAASSAWRAFTLAMLFYASAVLHGIPCEYLLWDGGACLQRAACERDPLLSPCTPPRSRSPYFPLLSRDFIKSIPAETLAPMRSHPEAVLNG